MQLSSVQNTDSIRLNYYLQASYQPGAGGFFGSASDAAGGVGGLEEAIPGTPGEDYPIYASPPESSFVCDGQVDGGYYGDPEAECQAFHICAGDGSGGLSKYSFLCPNGTLFQQQYFVCDWWFNVDCSTTEDFYGLNDEIAAERESLSGDQGQYAGAGGAAQYAGGAGARAGGRGGNQKGGSRAAASSPRGSYTSPSGAGYAGPSDSYSGAEDAGSGYGAPGGDYGAPGGYEGRGRGRNARGRNARGISANNIVSRSLGLPIEEVTSSTVTFTYLQICRFCPPASCSSSPVQSRRPVSLFCQRSQFDLI